MAEAPTSQLERRLRAEWSLLERLIAANPGRLHDPRAEDRTLHLTLRQTPALLPGPAATLLHNHPLRIHFPEYFPAAPMELYLAQPVLHPNIHPETGFVCLWDRHRVSNTVEHALHKLVAMLTWRLYTLNPLHLMQPEALHADPELLAARLTSPPLRGLAPTEPPLPPQEPRRVRLA